MVAPVFSHLPTFQSSTEDTLPCVAEPLLPDVLPDVLPPVLGLGVAVATALLARPCWYCELLRKELNSVSVI